MLAVELTLAIVPRRPFDTASGEAGVQRKPPFRHRRKDPHDQGSLRSTFDPHRPWRGRQRTGGVASEVATLFGHESAALREKQ